MNATAQIGLGNLRESRQTSLEISLLTLYFEIKVASQRLISQGRDKNRLRLRARIRRNSIRQLVDVAEETGFQQRVNHLLACQAADVFLAEVHELLLRVGIHLDAEHFSAFATHHFADRSAHW